MRGGRYPWSVAAMASWLALAPLSPAAETGDTNGVALEQPKSTPAEQAWADLLTAISAIPSSYPVEWLTNRPAPQAYAEYRLKLSASEASAARKARDFYTVHPDDPHAVEARSRESQLLQAAAQMGDTNAVDLLAELDNTRLNAPGLSEDERFQLKSTAARRQMLQASVAGPKAKALEIYEQQARALQREFPNRTEPWEMLLDIAGKLDDVPAQTLAREIAETSAGEDIRRQAGQVLKSLDQLGKPLKMKFTAMDKRPVDLDSLRGRVVLLIFWATWCGPYVSKVEDDLAIYERWHPKGLEVVGICFDRQETPVTQFIGDHHLPWPQYYDGQGWRTKYAIEWGVRHLPSYWLIDKTGVLRELHAQRDLEKNIERLLSETP